MHALKGKEFTNVRKWIVANLDNDHTRIYRRIYDSLYESYLDAQYYSPTLLLYLGNISINLPLQENQEINMLSNRDYGSGEVQMIYDRLQIIDNLVEHILQRL